MKIVVVTVYENASRSFLNWMADNMKEQGQISNEQASKLKKGELEVTRKSEDPNEPMVSTTKWEVIP